MMLLKGLQVYTEDKKTTLTKNLINLEEVKRIAFIEEDNIAEIYFKGSVGIDKKGEQVDDFVHIECNNPKALVDKLKELNITIINVE